MLGLGEKDHAVGKLLLPTGEEISTVVVSNLGHRENKAAGPNGEERLAVLVPQTQIRNVYHWLTSLSDGYVELVPGDPYMKVDGPFVVEAMAENEIPAHLSEVSLPAGGVLRVERWPREGKGGGFGGLWG